MYNVEQTEIPMIPTEFMKAVVAHQKTSIEKLHWELASWLGDAAGWRTDDTVNWVNLCETWPASKLLGSANDAVKSILIDGPLNWESHGLNLESLVIDLYKLAKQPGPKKLIGDHYLLYLKDLDRSLNFLKDGNSKDYLLVKDVIPVLKGLSKALVETFN